MIVSVLEIADDMGVEPEVVYIDMDRLPEGVYRTAVEKALHSGGSAQVADSELSTFAGEDAEEGALRVCSETFPLTLRGAVRLYGE